MKARTMGWVVVAVLLGGARVAAQEPRLLERTAGLEVVGVSVQNALGALQRASGVRLAFSPDVLPPGEEVTCRCRQVTVAQALDRILEGTGLRYVERGRQVLIARREDLTSATEELLRGVVVERDGGRPVPAAEVALVNGGRSAVTGNDGRFTLSGVDGEEVELRVTALGYEERAFTVLPSRLGPVRIGLERAPIPLDEIVIAPGRFGVLEVSPTVSAAAVTREDIEATPQIGDDVFRTLKRLPGVTTDDISTRLNIRGSTDRDLLVRLDGVELYEPYHLKDLDGALGIVDVQSLGGIDLITGGFPVEYGDKTAGVFDMHTRKPPVDGTRTTVGLSLSSVGANSQGSFDGGKGQWVAALRRGFLEYVLAVGGVDDDLNPRYWDALGRVQYQLTPGNRVSAEVLLAGDEMSWFDDNTHSRVDSDWSNHYAWLTWSAMPADRLHVETLLSAGGLHRDRVGLVSTGGRGAFTPLTSQVSDYADFSFTSVRQDARVDLTDDLLVKAGYEFRRSDGSYDYASSASYPDVDENGDLTVRYASNAVFLAPKGDNVGVYGGLRGRLGDAFTWEGGVRWDRQSYTDQDHVGPRVLLRWDPASGTSIRASWGRYTQSQELEDLRVQDGEDHYNGAEIADQAALGIGRDFGRGVTVRLEGYVRNVTNPLPTYVNLSREVNPISEVEGDRRRIDSERGRARGIETLVSQDGTGPFSWSASYVLAQAEDRVDGRWAPRTLDQRHTLTLQGAYRVGNTWQISGLWYFHTGWPFTAQTVDVRAVPTENGGVRYEVLGRGFETYNAERLPPYHRLDVRVTRSVQLRNSRLELYLDVFNAYNRTNLRGYEWGLRSARNGHVEAFREAGEEQLPLMPTLGFRWVF